MTNRLLWKLAAFAFLCGPLASLPADAWWNDEWAFRKEIAIDPAALGADLTGSVVDVPLLVRLSLANFGYFGDALPDGADLRFVAGDDKTPLTFHIESYDSLGQMAFLWVRLPRVVLGSGADRIYLYYGNPEAQSASNPGGTFDADQVLALHFDARAGTLGDATAYGYGNQPGRMDAEITPASLIGSGARFDGTQAIAIPAQAGLRVAADRGVTLSTWLRLDGAQSALIAGFEEGPAGVTLGVEGSDLTARIGGGAVPPVILRGTTPLSPGQWHHVALRLGNGRAALLLDGIQVAEAAVAVPDVGGTLSIGASAAGASYLVGELDALQVAATARSDAWLRVAALSQGMVAPFISYGGDVQREGGGGEGYFAITLRNVTFDGWVVVVILIGMFFMSLVIIVAKALYLSKVARGNDEFMSEFRQRADIESLERDFQQQGGDEGSPFEEAGESQLAAAVTASDRPFGLSTLYNLYHQGMRETLSRVSAQALPAGQAKTLSPASIQAIRAVMDAALVRSTQRLNSQMVLLTISISGGPFLGLLGTVVGVMITFAAIAAAGDVNVNAIAPGIAAALVATVAGLAVAIPALFGYNWLNTRIKEMVADMKVFVDEFVTRLAENYT